MSATVLRELVAKLGFQVDDAGFKKAAAGVEKIKSAVSRVDANVQGARGKLAAMGTGMATLGAGGQQASKGVAAMSGAVGGLSAGIMRLAATLGVGALLKQMVGLASDANETGNVVSEVFGPKGAAEVTAWANTTSAAMGRSKYTLIENAGALGAMLEPMTGSTEKAKEMATALGGLAVDLGSFFNASDEDALASLKSGMSGMGESLHKFGIVMTDATLQEYAHANGIKGKVATMNVAAKTELRYRFIMAQTTKAQGDAARTVEGFANASKKLQGQLKDLGTDIGQKLLPIAGKLLTWGGKITGVFLELSKKSYLVESALITLAGGFAIMNASAIAAFAVPLIAVGTLVVAVDELYTMFAGGKTVVGKWLDDTFGTGTTDKFVTSVRGVIDACKQLPSMRGMWQVWQGAVEDAAKSVQLLLDKLAALPLKTLSLLTGVDWEEANRKVLRVDSHGIRVLTKQADAEGSSETRDIGSRVLTDEENLARDRKEREQRIIAEEARMLQERADAERAAHEYRVVPPLAPGLLPVPGMPEMLGAPEIDTTGSGVLLRPALRDDSQDLRHGQARLRAPLPAAPAPAATTSVTVNHGPTTIVVGAGASEADKARALRQRSEADQRKTADALRRNGGK